MTAGGTNEFFSGSEWRRWDPHVHTKGTKKNDQFKSETFEEFCEIFFRKALENNVAAIGITDYFNIENYLQIVKFVKYLDTNTSFSEDEKGKIKRIFIFPNIELRMLPVTDSGRLVNIHALINPCYVDYLQNDFFNSIESNCGTSQDFQMNKQGIISFGKSQDERLDDENAYKKGINTFYITPKTLTDVLKKKPLLRENIIICVSNSNKDGASGLQEHYSMFEDIDESSLDAARKSIYCISDAIFSANERDFKYFAGLSKDDEKTVIQKCGSLKPCIHGSDAHKEDELFNPSENKYCWIKADLTFEGLKQIIFEPYPGERVKISPIEPDLKDDFKIIRKITFNNTNDFPSTVYFNKNLNSIIGSRSSGKSALLTYLADSIDPTQTRELRKDGPGDGYSWNDVKFGYSLEWWNGKQNSDNQGRIVFVPQNFLYEISKDSKKIKEKIKPVLFNRLPEIASKFRKTESSIRNVNEEIRDLTNTWFDLKSQDEELYKNIKDQGSQNSIEQEINKTHKTIEEIQKKYQLNESELEKYKELREELSNCESQLSIIQNELINIGEIDEEINYFSAITIDFIPSHKNLPNDIREDIEKLLIKTRMELIDQGNLLVENYIKKINQESKTISTKIKRILKENKEIIDKNKKNIQLETLIKKNSEYKQKLRTLMSLQEKVEEDKKHLSLINKQISQKIQARDDLLRELKESLTNQDQSTFDEMEFSFEFHISSKEKEKIQEKINMREKNRFIKSYQLLIEKLRKNPAEFLEDIYAEKLKINKGFEKIDAIQGVLTLTEEILISARMEGDTIGGISDSTMTAGKRALFALRLILAESDDTWPLIIDQPEDDLDSRSIFDEIVPFLRERKKERQIIMASHNANLVIGSDSELIIVANRNANDRKNIDGKQFNYITGSIENTIPLKENCEDTLTSQGIREHACLILEGGQRAFEQRINKFRFQKP